MLTARSVKAYYDAALGSRGARLLEDYTDRPEPPTSLEKSGAHVVNLAYKLDRFFSTTWHRRWERLPLRFTIAVVLTVVVASLFEIIPTFLIKSNVPWPGPPAFWLRRRRLQARTHDLRPVQRM